MGVWGYLDNDNDDFHDNIDIVFDYDEDYNRTLNV